MNRRGASQLLTFLFADVEGSTRLAEQHPADAGSALARYHDLISQIVTARGGRVFERIGDGAYASFADAVDAVGAAIDAQVAIGEEDWGPVGRLRIRIALVLNPDTPLECAAPILGLLMRHELRLVATSPTVAPAVRALCLEHLERRPPGEFPDHDDVLQ